MVELGLATASDKHSSAFLGETLSGAKANAGTAASHDCYLIFDFPIHKSIHSNPTAPACNARIDQWHFDLLTFLARYFPNSLSAKRLAAINHKF
jgi:hypothetical protein